MNYTGAFQSLAPQIVAMHAQGKKYSEIAAALAEPIKGQHGYWDYTLTAGMVAYILRRLALPDPPAPPPLICPVQWVIESDTDKPSQFERDARKLHALASWIVEELEKRQLTVARSEPVQLVDEIADVYAHT